MTLQSRLDDRSFARYLAGFEEITAEDLLSVRGGRVRYTITSPSGEVKYRLGGLLVKVDPGLRYCRLLNPYAKRAFSVQLRPRDGSRVRLWYMAPGTSDEIATLRDLLSKVERGEIVITRVRR